MTSRDDVACFRFAHLGDIRLGAPRFGLPALSGDGEQALRDAFRICREAEVDFLLLAGDLFYHREVPPEILLQAERALQEVRGIPVLAVGNEAGTFLRYLDGRGLLSCLTPSSGHSGTGLAAPWTPGAPSATYHDPLPGIRVHALAPDPEQRSRQLTQLPRGKSFNLGILPGSRDLLEDSSLPTLGKILDFLACGGSDPPGRDGWSCSPGALLPLDLNEVREGGCGFYLVNHGEGGFDAEWMEVPGRPVIRLPDLDASRVEIPGDLEELLPSHLAGTAVPREALVILRLRGKVPFHFVDLDPGILEGALRRLLGVKHVVLSNELNLLRGEVEAGPLDRRAIEREVLQEALSEELPEEDGRHPELLDLLESIRRREPESDRDLIDILELARDLLGDDQCV